MPGRGTWLDQDTLDRADATLFEQARDDAVSSLRFHSALPTALDGLKSIRRAFEQPIIVSDRPDAGQIAQQQQAAAPSSGTPVAMPTAPQSPDVTMTAGRTSLPAGASIGPADASGRVGSAPTGYAPSTARGDDGVEQWSPIISEAARQYGVPEAVVKGIMTIESGGNPSAVSAAGALGLMQTMPFHYQPGEDGMDPRTNILRGTKILADNYARYGDWDRAAAAYFGAIDGNGNITDATDATGTNGSKYVALFRGAANRYGGIPGAAPSVSAAPPSAAPAASPSVPSAPAASSLPQPASGGSERLTIRNKRTGFTSTISRDGWNDTTNKDEFEIVGDAPQAMTAAALSLKAGAPDGGDAGQSQQSPELQQLLAGTDTSTQPQMLRGPLQQAPAEATPSAEYDPRDADQGAHEAYTDLGSQPSGGVPTASGTAMPEGQTAPAPPSYEVVGAGPTSEPPQPGFTRVQNPASQSGEMPLAQPVTAQDDGPLILDQSIPSPPGWSALVNAAGQVVQWVQDKASSAVTAVQGAADSVYQSLEPARQAAASLDSSFEEPLAPDEQVDVARPSQHIPGAVERALTRPIKPPEREKPLMGPFDLSGPEFPDQESRNAHSRAQGGLSSDVADIPYQAAEGGRQAIMEAAQSFADALRSGQQGRSLAAAGNALWGAVQVAGLPWTVAAKTVNQMFPEANVGGFGVGDAATSIDLLRLGIQGVNGLKNLPGRLTPENLAAIHDAPGNAVRGAADAIDRGIEAASPVAQRIRGALDANASRVAAADARAAEQGSVSTAGTFGQAAPESRRVYHGTAGAFERPDPERFDPDGLFGPGYYTTSDPRVAGSYAWARSGVPDAIARRVEELQQSISEHESALRTATDPNVRRVHEGRIDYYRETLRDLMDTWKVGEEPANVRAVDVPNDLNLLNVERTYGDDAAKQIGDAVERNAGPDMAGRFDEAIAANPTGGDIYEALVRAGEGDKTWANEQLRRMGYDGIEHKGGQRVPLLDENGKPIEHDVTVVFGDALNRLRNGFSGEVGGATLGISPGRASGILDTVARDAGSSIGSSMLGATAAAATDPGSPQGEDESDADYATRRARERAMRIATGGGIGLVAGPAARRLARGDGAMATFGMSPNYKPPTAQQIARAEQQATRRGEMLNREVTAPGSAVPLRVRVATAATDDRAGLRWAEDVLSDTAGSPRMRENDPARPSTQTRVNSGSIADSRIENELTPSILNAGEAGLQHELPQYLEDMHAKDILDDFYRRAHQAVTDRGAETIAELQRRGASPARIQATQARINAEADKAGIAAMRKRQGGNADKTYEAIEARLQAQEQRLTADGRWQQLQDTAQGVWDHNAETRRRLVDAGELDPAAEADLAQRYPHYVPTVPISHLDSGPSGAVASGGGPTVSRGSQPVVRALDDVGTSGESLNPIVASRNATVRAERAIQKNNTVRAFAQMMDDALSMDPKAMGVDPATHRTFLGGGKDIIYFEGGKPVTISVPKVVADGLEAAANMGADPGTVGRIWKTIMGVVTSAMTAGRASFLPVNLLRDVQDYATRTATLEGGGAHRIPGVMGDWFQEAGKAAADIVMAQANPRGYMGAATGFAAGAMTGDENTTTSDRLRHGVEGAVAGTFLLGANKVRPSGKAAEYIARGGGSGGLSANWRAGQRWYREVMRDGGAPISSASDAARHLGDWLQDAMTLQGVKGINERTELVSRTAAMRRAEKVRGLDPTEAMIAGRDASYDPDRAGVVARAVNGIVPFFNASVQNAAQTARLFKQNPAAATATIASTLAPVMLLTEAWNRSDPERARVYDDVPQYVKDTGIVVATPWAGSDNRGERPNYLWLPTGLTTPIVMAMRKAMEGTPGLEPTAGRTGSRPDASDPERWANTLADVAMSFSPIRGDSASSLASNMVPQGAKQAVELGINKDLYRGNPIVTDNADERASAFSRKVAEGANAAGRAVGNDWLQEIHPSGVEHVVRSLPAYSDIVTGASDMVAPSGFKQAEDRPIANEPFVGSIASRFVRDTGGANLQRAQDERLPDSVRSIFEDAGLRPSDMLPVGSRWKNGPLSRDEQLAWQSEMNAAVEQTIDQARRDPKWRNPATQEQAIRDAIAKARDIAARRARLPSESEMERRIQEERGMKAS